MDYQKEGKQIIVKGHHPIVEIVARKLFGFENVPLQEQKRMVQRCATAVYEYHLVALKSAVEEEREACANVLLNFARSHYALGIDHSDAIKLEYYAEAIRARSGKE